MPVNRKTLIAELEKKKAGLWNGMLPKTVDYFIRGPCYQWGGLQETYAAIGDDDELLTLVMKLILRWFGHVSRSSGLAEMIMHGTIKGRRSSRQKKMWEDIIRSWQEWTLPAQLGHLKQNQMERDSCEVICGAPTIFQVYGIEKNRIELLWFGFFI